MPKGFQKGRAKTGGRQKGVRNKTSFGLKMKLEAFLDCKMEIMDELFDQLQPRDKLNLLAKLLPMVLPKEVELKLEDLSDDQIFSLYERIKNQRQAA